MIAINVHQPLTDRPTWSILYFDGIPAVHSYFKFPEDSYHVFQVEQVIHLPTVSESTDEPRVTIYCTKLGSKIPGIDYNTSADLKPKA